MEGLGGQRLSTARRDQDRVSEGHSSVPRATCATFLAARETAPELAPPWPVVWGRVNHGREGIRWTFCLKTAGGFPESQKKVSSRLSSSRHGLSH